MIRLGMKAPPSMAQSVVLDRWKQPNLTHSPDLLAQQQQNAGLAPMGGAAPKSQWKTDRYLKDEVSGLLTRYSKTDGPLKTNVDIYKRPEGTIRADVSFEMPGKPHLGKGSTGRGLRHFDKVMENVREFVDKVKPANISFIPATEKHQKLYDRFGPHMAEALGGKFSQYDWGGLHYYNIDLPGAKVWGK